MCTRVCVHKSASSSSMVSPPLAGLPCVAISNFSWDFIYSEYLLHHGAKHSAIVQQIANDYAQAPSSSSIAMRFLDRRC